MNGPDGKWIGWGLDDDDPKVADLKAFMRAKFASYAGDLADTTLYDQQMVDAVKEMQSRYGLPVTGVINWQTQVRMGYLKPETPAVKPILVSVEGHMSDMWSGPVADTCKILEQEGVGHWQPIGYASGSLPFDNQSGVNELARILGQPTLDNGVPFPLGTPWILCGFSQGAIVVYDAYRTLLQDGQIHAPRAKDLKGVLTFGNPCRQSGSIAPWALDLVQDASGSGLDPLKRFGLPGNPTGPAHPWADVFRQGDLFADAASNAAFGPKAAVYQAVARADFFSDPYSLVAQIADLFSEPFDEIWAIFLAIVDGIKFLAGKPNPHYDPWETHTMAGGIQWLKDRLADPATIAA
ncbi:peptidoglycan-binding domain-containing protein [Mycobacterium sp. CSUR Q5927]|nr:peptidoglycan-binding domain-containing protein [Mycobacterium sp. CSUR Q5927]